MNAAPAAADTVSWMIARIRFAEMQLAMWTAHRTWNARSITAAQRTARIAAIRKLGGHVSIEASQVHVVPTPSWPTLSIFGHSTAANTTLLLLAALWGRRLTPPTGVSHLVHAKESTSLGGNHALMKVIGTDGQ